MEALTSSGLVPELLEAVPARAVEMQYRDGVTVDFGNINTPTQVRFPPVKMDWHDMKPDHFYTVIMIDPDMPARDTPIKEKTQVLHWLNVNIPGKGFGGRELAPYIGSGPPPGTGIHRYTFLVFDEGTTPKDFADVPPMDLIDVDRRVNWSFTGPAKNWTLRDFLSWAKLGNPVAANFYQAQWDKQVDNLWRTFNHFYGENLEGFTTCGLVPELLDDAPQKPVEIKYRDGAVVNIGNVNTPTQVRYPPLSMDWSEMKPDHFYTVIMIDPDMPARDTPIKEKTQVLHWLNVNIPGKGFGGRELAPYIGSGPPPGTGIHRYTFLVFDEGINAKDYSDVPPMDLIDVDRRVNWSLTGPAKSWTYRDFVSWAKLGNPVAGNFYQAQWDKQVDILWRTFNHFYK